MGTIPFKYAVPKAIGEIKERWKCGEDKAYIVLFQLWLKEGHDALALFWAIWEVIHDR